MASRPLALHASFARSLRVMHSSTMLARPSHMLSTSSTLSSASSTSSPLLFTAFSTSSSSNASSHNNTFLRTRTTLSSSHTTTTTTTTSLTRRSMSSSSPADKASDLTKVVAERLQTATPQQLFEYSQYSLLGLFPVAFILSPSVLTLPVDLALGVVLPYHAYRGVSHVIEDYVPRSNQGVAKGALVVVLVLTALGLLKVNLCGAGIAESVKSLWRVPPTPAASTTKSKSS